jgi:hypothetical protein
MMMVMVMVIVMMMMMMVMMMMIKSTFSIIHTGLTQAPGWKSIKPPCL